MSEKTLREFIGKVKQGLARTSHYNVTFSPPSCINKTTFNGNIIRTILLFCEQTQLPSLNIATTPNRTWGEIRQMPYDKEYQEINLTFYVDKEMKVKLFFDQWMNAIKHSVSGHMAYYNDYIVDVKVEVFDVGENSRYIVTLKEAYPKNISAVEMNYGGKDVMRIQVSMTYKNWESNATIPASEVSGIPQKNSFGKIIASGMEIPNKVWNSYTSGDWKNVLKSMDLPQLF